MFCKSDVHFERPLKQVANISLRHKLECFASAYPVVDLRTFYTGQDVLKLILGRPSNSGMFTIVRGPLFERLTQRESRVEPYVSGRARRDGNLSKEVHKLSSTMSV